MIKIFKKGHTGLKEVGAVSSNCWVKVVDPTEKEIAKLISDYNLSKNLILDGLDIYENTRIEEEENKVYIFLRYPLYNVNRTAYSESTNSFLFVISKSNILTISRKDIPLFDKLSSSRAFLSENPINSLLVALYYISRSFEDNVRLILKSVNKDRANISKLGDRDILSLVVNEDILNDYLSSFPLLLRVMENLKKTKSIKLRNSEKEFLGDLFIDLNQSFEICRSALKGISNMRDYYSTALTSNLNKIITLLTVFTIFLTVPTVVSSIYGMNIALPLQSSPQIFGLLSGLIFGIWALLFFIFKKTKIL